MDIQIKATSINPLVFVRLLLCFTFSFDIRLGMEAMVVSEVYPNGCFRSDVASHAIIYVPPLCNVPCTKSNERINFVFGLDVRGFSFGNPMNK